MNWEYPEVFSVIVVGAGHAGCEAAHAAAKILHEHGGKVLLLTLSMDAIARMSCNPAIGGIGKGHIVREIDALGGIMGQAIDQNGIQYRMLNATKGPAVWAPRAQADKAAYQQWMTHYLQELKGLSILQGSVEDLVVEEGQFKGVRTKEGLFIRGESCVLSSGTFMRGLIHIGNEKMEGGRASEPAAKGISTSLERLGLALGRLKTGTPPRVHKDSIDYSLCEEQPGEEDVYFSYTAEKGLRRLKQLSCHITYTTPETNEVIRQNLDRSPLYQGVIKGVGPRYCPSIEDKVVRFSDKERHQLFLEPEGLTTKEVYVNGISTSLPIDVQYAILRSIPALKNAVVMRWGYAIEYDYVLSHQLKITLECKNIRGLFLAGQINGTTGYEEAAGQGLVAGINAALQVQGKEPFYLSRSEAYIGVMIDDLITKGVDEPYRMFTSRAEYRMELRQDNADRRLRKKGFEVGLVEESIYQSFLEKESNIKEALLLIEKKYVQEGPRGYSLKQLLSRPEETYRSLNAKYPGLLPDLTEEESFQVTLDAKYSGYIGRQNEEIKRHAHYEDLKIPTTIDWKSIVGLRTEARQRLEKSAPYTLGIASRIPGITPSDISVLLVHLKKVT